MDRVSQLVRDYWDAANERGPHLEEFTAQASRGEKGGPVTPEELRRFLQAVREAIVENIETKAQAGGPWAMMKDQVIADTEAEIDELIARYAKD